MKIINWFGLYPVEQIKTFYKKIRKIEKCEKTKNNQEENDNYKSRSDYYEKTRQDWNINCKIIN